MNELQHQITINSDYLLSRKSWNEYLSLSKRNPAIMMKAGLDYLTMVTEGKLDWVDVSNPPTLCMEFAAQLAANNFNHFESADKKHYPILSTKMEDLYHHMSGELYRGRFASPAMGKFQMAFVLSEILEYAAQSEIEGIRKILIPRGTMFMVDGIPFTLLNAIEIRVNQYNAIQVVYSHNYRDNYEVLESNILEYFYARSRINEEIHESVIIEVPVLQCQITKKTSDTTFSGDMYNEVFSYDDQFIQARVYLHHDNGKLEEIKTTHSEMIYNPNVITARLSVMTDNLLRVDIPMLYYNIEKIEAARVIVEIYTTKGKVNLLSRKISETSGIGFEFDDDTWVNREDYIYTRRLSDLSFLVVASTDCIGGSNGLSFDTVKKWVVQGGQYENDPITYANIKMHADIMGYGLVTDIDHITNRIFQATREIEQAPGSEFSRGAGCSIESVVVKLDEIGSHPHVNEHDNRWTILPTALFKTVNGITTLLNTTEIPEQQGDNIDQYITDINSLEYVYTPFHYCLDLQDTRFVARPYYMDAPKYLSHNYIDNNDHVQLLVAIDRVEIARKPYGYSIIVVTRSGDEYKQLQERDVFVQLAYRPANQNELAYINGEYLGTIDENHVYEFELHTTFDFDSQHNLILNNFNILTKEKRELPCPLNPEFYVVFGIYDYQEGEIEIAAINEHKADYLLDHTRKRTVLAINNMRVRLGYALTNLWCNVRTTQSSPDYERYQEDVPLTYTERVYRLGENGMPIFSINNDGQYQFEVLHEIGEEVLDDDGNIIYKHLKGDPILTEDGGLKITKPKGVQRIIDIFFIDGIYRFSTNEEDLDYIQNIPETIINWLETDIKKMQSTLMENTDLFFMPKRTMGYINILVENGIQKTIFNRLPFKVKYYLTNRAYQNAELKEAIAKMTACIINEQLKKQVISKDVIEQALRETGGSENILGVNILDMGINSDTNTFTILGQGNQCSVRRKIALLPDGQLKVKEDIFIEYVNHESTLKQASNLGSLGIQ